MMLKRELMSDCSLEKIKGGKKLCYGYGFY